MSERPKVGDVISVTLTGKYNELPSGAGYIGENPGRWVFPSYAKVEILEPADDPSKDPVGTVRGERGWSFVCRERAGTNIGPWVLVTRPFGQRVIRFSWEDSQVTGFPIIGVVPGSPADKPQAEFYRGLDSGYRILGDEVRFYDPTEKVWRLSGFTVEKARRTLTRLDSDPTDGR